MGEVGKIYAIGGTDDEVQSFTTVEVYDTGFLPQSVTEVEKFATLWGQIKAQSSSGTSFAPLGK